MSEPIYLMDKYLAELGKRIEQLEMKTSILNMNLQSLSIKVNSHSQEQPQAEEQPEEGEHEDAFDDSDDGIEEQEDERELNVEQLKPCPLCGRWSYNLDFGEVNNPSAYWDGGVRGEECAYIMCTGCNLILKAYDLREAKEMWNRRDYKKDD